MKKLIFLSLMSLCAFTVSAQSNYSSPGIPSGTTSTTISARIKPATPDSLAQIWLGIGGNKFYRMATGMDDIVFSAVNFKGAGTTSSKLDLNNSIHLTDTVFAIKGMQIGDTLTFTNRNYDAYQKVGSRGGKASFGYSQLDGGGAYIATRTQNDIAHTRAIYAAQNYTRPTYSDDGGATRHFIPVIDTFIGATLDTLTHALTVTGGGGGGNTIYTANDSLTSNRKVTFVTHKLELGDLINVKAYVDIDPTTNAVNIYTYGATSNSTFNIADDAFFLSNSNPGSGYSANFQVSGNDDSKAAAITSVSPSGSNRFQMYASGAGVYTDGIGSKGIIYANNYGANFTARSLVDKQYVDSVATAIGGGGSFINNSDITSSPQNASIWLDNTNAMQVGSGSLNSQMSNGNVAQFVSGTGFVSMTHNDLNWQSGASHTYDFHVDSTGNKFTISASSGTHYLFLSEVQSQYQPTTGNDLIRKRDADSLYAPISGSGVTSVSGTTNRIISTGGTTPVIDVSSTFEALLGKVANPLSQFASTTSAQLAGVLSDETGTDKIVYSTSPTLVTPNLGTPSTLVLTNATGLPNAGLTNSSITVNGTSIALGASGTVTAAAGTLTGTTLNSTVVTSSLTSAALANLTATDATLTFSGAYNGNTARAVGLNLGNANTWTAAPSVSLTGVTTSTTTDGLVLLNPTITTSGATQYNSPVIRWTGHAWNTTSVAADNQGDYIMGVNMDRSNPAFPDPQWILANRLSASGSGAYSTVMKWDYYNGLTITGVASVSGNIISTGGDIKVNSGSVKSFNYSVPTSGNTMFVGNGNNFSAAGTNLNLAGSTATNSSGQFNAVSITPTYNQTSTASATDFLINRTQTAVGSGAQLFIDAQVAGTSKFKVDNTGLIQSQALTASKVVFTDASKNLTSTGIGTSSQYIAGDGSLGTIGAKAHNISTPTTGGTVSLTNNQYNIINPAGTLATLTINLPSSPANNDCVYIKYTQAITAVTYGNGTVVDGITAPTAGGLVVLTYDSGTTSWY